MPDEYNPFQSPELAPAQPPYPISDSPRPNYVPFASGHARGVFTMSLLGLLAFLDAVGCFACYSQNNLLDAMSRGQRFSHDVIAANDAFVNGISYAIRIGNLVVAISFLMWVHRTYRNLPALGAKRLEMTPAWAVGWWFVPFANLVKPYQSTAETWRYSDPRQADKLRKTTSAFVALWWGMFWVSRFAYQYGNWTAPAALQRPTFASLENMTATKMTIYAIELVAAVIAIALVFKIDKNQESMNDLVQAQQTAIPMATPTTF